MHSTGMSAAALPIPHSGPALTKPPRHAPISDAMTTLTTAPPAPPAPPPGITCWLVCPNKLNSGWGRTGDLQTFHLTISEIRACRTGTPAPSKIARQLSEISVVSLVPIRILN
eukprot:scaffold23291_cov63-Phaeocystis_antarctica.AAC.2